MKRTVKDGKRLPRNEVYRRNPALIKRGQAILELAIFGSLLIMLLGILLNYGLRYNAQQQVTQHAFRKALVKAYDAPYPGKPISTTEVMVNDLHIPDPGHAFGLGSVTPVSSSASLIRNPKMELTPDNSSEAPQIDININGEVFPFKTAKVIGLIRDLTVNQLKKYQEIYGANSIWITGASWHYLFGTPGVYGCNNKE